MSATIPNAKSSLLTVPGTVSNDDFESAESDTVLDSTTSMDVSTGSAHAEEAVVTDPPRSPQEDVSSPEHAGIYFACAVHAFYVHLPLKRQVAVETMLYSISLIDSHALQTEREPWHRRHQPDGKMKRSAR